MPLTRIGSRDGATGAEVVASVAAMTTAKDQQKLTIYRNQKQEARYYMLWKIHIWIP
jgi:hypothetical protein